ncbi:hypothetical protein HRbin23_00357 [bacterium HR23]|nr:hypothetical protein HRbin23_00357 [bacterium HR23]
MADQEMLQQPSAEALSQALADAQTRIATLEEEAETLRQQARLALARYRSLLIAQAPEVPEELVQGETVEAVEESFARARALVERVRRQVEASLQRGRVAGGAPLRRGTDLDTLPPSEKIRLGLQRLAQQP